MKIKLSPIKTLKWFFIVLASLLLFVWGQDVTLDQKIKWSLGYESRIEYGWMYVLIGAFLSLTLTVIVTACVVFLGMFVVGKKALAVEFRRNVFGDSFSALYGASLFGALVGIGADVMLPPIVLVVALASFIYHRLKRLRPGPEKTNETNVSTD